RGLHPQTTMLTAVLLAAVFHFEVEEGQNINCFLRDGKAAAHVVLRSGATPRILVAFPAGNSGVGLWFQQTSAQWVVDSLPKATTAADAKHRTLYGVTFETSTGAQSLVPKQTILSSVRVLRDYESSGTVPAQVLVHPVVTGNTLAWSRDRIDGAPGYRLTIR